MFRNYRQDGYDTSGKKAIQQLDDRIFMRVWTENRLHSCSLVGYFIFVNARRVMDSEYRESSSVNLYSSDRVYLTFHDEASLLRFLFHHFKSNKENCRSQSSEYTYLKV